MTNPLVSVVMPAYNRAEYICSAIDSVLMQTFKDFELIIVDDGSTDTTVEKINTYDDPRIRLIQHEVNKGVAAARNTGYRNSKGEFIVIADSDDINLPTKFEEQVNYLDENTDIDIVGCQYQHFNGIDFLDKWDFPIDSNYIRNMRVFMNVQAPASMFRKSKIEKLGLLYHDESFPAAVDTNWYSKMPKEVKFTNIPRVLYLYRRHPHQITSDSLAVQLNYVEVTKMQVLKNIGIEVTVEDRLTHYTLYDYDSLLKNQVSFEKVKNWVEKLIKANKESKENDDVTFTKLIAEKFYGLCVHYFYLGSVVWKAWDCFEHKNLIEKEEIILSNEKIIRLGKNRKIAVFGTYRSAYIILKRLNQLGINVEYIIDNKWSQKTKQMDSYPIHKMDILKTSPIDVLILSTLSERSFILKDYFKKNHPSMQIFSIKDLT